MERGSAEEAILAQERDALDRWSSGDPEGYVQSADEDVGILTQHYYPTSLEGEAMGPSKATCVYRRTDGTWHLVHSHWSILKEG